MLIFCHFLQCPFCLFASALWHAAENCLYITCIQKGWFPDAHTCAVYLLVIIVILCQFRPDHEPVPCFINLLNVFF